MGNKTRALETEHQTNKQNKQINPLMLELKPSVQCSRARFFTGDFKF